MLEITKESFLEWLKSLPLDEEMFYTSRSFDSCPITMYARHHGFPKAISSYGEIRDCSRGITLARQDWILTVQDICDTKVPKTPRKVLTVLQAFALEP